MDDKTLHDASALLGESYSDYAVLVRTQSGAVYWRTSNTTWADGAMMEYQRHLAVLQSNRSRRDIQED